MPRRIGRPGLIGTVVRTAAIAGTAQAVAGGVAQHQRNSAAAKQQEQSELAAAAAAPAPIVEPPAVTDELMEHMAQLVKLHEAGILSDDEFTAAKAKALGI